MRTLALLPAFFGIPSFATLINTQFPHLLIPLVSTSPDTAFGTQKDATVSYSSSTGAQQWTAISFDVPNNAATICRLNFKVNTDPSMGAPFELNGTAPFAINISRIKPTLNAQTTTWNNRPATIDYYDTYTISQDKQVTEINSKWFDCPKGMVAQFIIHPASQRDLDLYWFELAYGADEGGPHGVVLEMHA
ncbi:hypothetical protein EJ02DRAFT_245564 [Clathrospora elynae]|uniref:Ubiquitin 3 binding protein But2 C-terminal domain-containing protein n=1 Tax=Clathrospora elynae TaxID=706981 RepID=A0A6A5SMM7_9PLEO|nr:hypothetical protein EJ02DRAFT_245564 [Clathrospora elynae]